MNGAQGNQGLQGGWALDDKGNVNFIHSTFSQLGFMQQAGAGWVRINFRLGRCFADWTSPAPAACVAANPSVQGKTAVDLYNQVVQGAQGSNLQILGLLSNESWHGGQGDWTANNAENVGGDGSNAYIDGFVQNAVAVLVAAFPQIAQWEIWNEPNAWTSNPAPGVFTGGTFIYPSNFAQILAASYAAVKNANPAAAVISAGIFCHDRDRGTGYLTNTYDMGINNAGWAAPFPLDGVGQHLYVDQGGETSGDNLAGFLQDFRNAYLAYEGGDTSKQTHITEVGWTTASVSADVQAQNLQTAYSTFQNANGVGRAYWFSIQDVPEGHVYYGLVDSHGAQKPSFAAYQTSATY